MQNSATQESTVSVKTYKKYHVSTTFPSPELAVIGCVLRGSWETFDVAVMQISEGDFRSEDAALLWGYLADLRVQNASLDPTHIGTFLKEKGDSEITLPLAHEAYNCVATPTAVEAWARQLKVAKWQSALKDIAEIASSDTDVNGDVGAVIEEVYDAAAALYVHYANDVLSPGFLPGSVTARHDILLNAAGIDPAHATSFLRLARVSTGARRNPFWTVHWPKLVGQSIGKVAHWVACPTIDNRFLLDQVKASGGSADRLFLSDIDPSSKGSVRSLFRQLYTRVVNRPGGEGNDDMAVLWLDSSLFLDPSLRPYLAAELLRLRRISSLLSCLVADESDEFLPAEIFPLIDHSYQIS